MTYRVAKAFRILSMAVFAQLCLSIPESLADNLASQSNLVASAEQLASQSLVRRANKGDVEAQAELGRLYLTGALFPKNYSEAFRWLELASQKGSVQAQIDLGLMYYGGIGVTQSIFDAYVWFNIASALGSSVAVEKRELVGGHLTEKDILTAQTKSREWLLRAGYTK